MVTMKVAVGTLNGRHIGRFTDLETLGSDATLQEALDYGYVTGKKSSLAAVAEGVLKAMIDDFLGSVPASPLHLTSLGIVFTILSIATTSGSSFSRAPPRTCTWHL